MLLRKNTKKNPTAVIEVMPLDFFCELSVKKLSTLHFSAYLCRMIRRNIIFFTVLCLCMLTETAQAQHVSYRSTAHYNKRVAQFEREGGINGNSIVMLGNSLTENGKDWSERLGISNIVNRGIIGDNTIGMTERLCQITTHHPKAIFLMAGINNMVNDAPCIDVAQQVIGLIETIRQQAPTTKLYVESLLPINEKSGRWRTLANRTNDIPLTNMYIRAYCESNGITFVDLFHQMTYPNSNMLRDELSYDGLHITEAGYEIWAKEIKRQLNHGGR